MRRERYEPPARGYWAGKLAMRGWAAYLAQILQFQCQLADLPAGGGPAAPGTCEEALDEARRVLAAIESDIRR